MKNNFSISFELSKFKSVICKMKNSEGVLTEGIFIPFLKNRLEKTEKNQVFVNAIAFENDEIKFDNTHSIKQSLPKPVLDLLSSEEKKLVPYIGNMKPFVTKTDTTNATVEENPVFDETEENNLPF